MHAKETQLDSDSDSNSDSDSDNKEEEEDEAEQEEEPKGKQSDKEVVGDKRYSTEKEAGNDARTSNGRFISVPGERNTYRCATDGCNCVHKVHFNVRRADYSLITTDSCTHTDMNCGKWTYLPQQVQSTFDACCSIKIKHPHPLPWLSYNGYTGP